MEYEIEIFAIESGNEPFRNWIDSLKDLDTQALVFQRLQRIRLGNFGDCKSLKKGIWELRIHHKSGLRIYYSRIKHRLILILGGGIKRTQDSDILKAQKYLEDYKRRKK